MSDCWQTLGIETTQDMRAIKMAYAKLLKITRPDQDPAAFQILHGAYEEAQYFAKSEWYWDEEPELEQISEIARSIPVNLALDTVYDVSVTSTEAPLDVIGESQIGSSLKHLSINDIDWHQTPIERQVDADAAAFFEGVLLPNEWLAEFQDNYFSFTSDYEEKLRASIQQTNLFGQDVWLEATHVVLRRVESLYNHYVKTQLNDGRPFSWVEFDGFVQEQEFPSLSILKEISQALHWWKVPMLNIWTKEYSSAVRN